MSRHQILAFAYEMQEAEEGMALGVTLESGDGFRGTWSAMVKDLPRMEWGYYMDPLDERCTLDPEYGAGAGLLVPSNGGDRAPGGEWTDAGGLHSAGVDRSGGRTPGGGGGVFPVAAAIGTIRDSLRHWFAGGCLVCFDLL